METPVRIEGFKEEEGDFETYEERLQHYFIANEVVAEKKMAVLLTLLNGKAYKTAKSLVAPLKLTEVSYDVVVDALKKHYNPTRLEIMERYRFYVRDQQEGEDIAKYVVSLKTLADTCSFGEFLASALRDRFVVGVKNETIRKKLLSVGSLTFDKAVKIALSIELAEQQAKLIHTGEMVPLHKVIVNKPEKKENYAVAKRAQPRRDGMQTSTARQQTSQCHRCGKWNHAESKCFAAAWKCFKCEKKGHTARMCPANKINLLGNKEEEETDENQQESEDECFMLGRINCNKLTVCNYTVEMIIEGKKVVLEIDTGAAVSVCPSDKFKKYFAQKVGLKPCNILLNTYSGEKLCVLGQAEVEVQYKDQGGRLPLIVVKNEGNLKMPLLLGRNWLQKFKLDWKKIMTVRCGDRLKSLKAEFKEVFENQGLIQGFKATILMKKDVTPIFCKAYNVPYALRDTVGKELLRQEKEGILERVQHSQWASPIVVVQKPDGGVRICGDFKVTLNKFLETEHYPLPTIEDIFATIGSGNTVFTVLDLSQAYLQLPVDKESVPLLTINTHMGLFRFTRMPYGISSAPSIFQAIMDQIVRDVDKVSCYLDDVLIAGRNEEECHTKVVEVLTRLKRYGVKVNENKCQFYKKEVKYLGHSIDNKGLHPIKEKCLAIKNAPDPCNRTQLKSYLGLVHYYGKFIPMLASRLQPLYALLSEKNQWVWGDLQKKAFEESKKLLTSDQVLAYFDAKKPILVTCDASPYGVGAVMSHVESEGEERPVLFVSRSLSKCEKGYAQLEKEALAIIFAVKKFHKYLYGRKFTLITDHAPLTAILGPNRGIPTLAAARMQRWALILAAHNYDIKYRKGSMLANADALSRLPLPENEGVEINYFSPVAEVPLVAKEVGKETIRDTMLRKVKEFTQEGWPRSCPETKYMPYFVRKEELSIDQDCVTWANRVVIPLVLRKQVLDMLHEEHPGISRMKMLARSYVWWPGIDKDVEKRVQECEVCQFVQQGSQPVPLCQWKLASRNWQRIHVDFAKVEGANLLIVFDTFSKWVEVKLMQSCTAEKTLAMLRSIFTIWGLPEQMVTDNGPPFSSREFENFKKKMGIKSTFSPPIHPQSNGSAEKAVQMVKRALLKQLLEKRNLDLQLRVDNFLFAYRNTPSTVTGQTPAELMLKRKPRTRLTYLRPDIHRELEEKQQRVKRAQDQHRGTMRTFVEGDQVLVKCVRGERQSWEKGKVVKIKSPVTYLVWVGNRLRFVHADHLRQSQLGEEQEWTEQEWTEQAEEPGNPPEEEERPEHYKTKEVQAHENGEQGQPEKTGDELKSERQERRQPIELRRSERCRRAPVRLDL